MYVLLGTFSLSMFHVPDDSNPLFFFLICEQTVLWNTVATECLGDGDLLNNLRIKNVLTGEEKDLAVRGLFYAIGMSLLRCSLAFFL